MASWELKVKELGLEKAIREGGYCRFLYLFGDGAGASYVLVTKDEFISLHRKKNDEIYFFLDGGKAELVTADGKKAGSEKVRKLDEKNRSAFVKAGEWQALRLVEGEWALLSSVMSPHYSKEDYEAPDGKFKDEHAELDGFFRN